MPFETIQVSPEFANSLYVQPQYGCLECEDETPGVKMYLYRCRHWLCHPCWLRFVAQEDSYDYGFTYHCLLCRESSCSARTVAWNENHQAWTDIYPQNTVTLLELDVIHDRVHELGEEEDDEDYSWFELEEIWRQQILPAFNVVEELPGKPDILPGERRPYTIPVPFYPISCFNQRFFSTFTREQVETNLLKRMFAEYRNYQIRHSDCFEEPTWSTFIAWRWDKISQYKNNPVFRPVYWPHDIFQFLIERISDGTLVYQLDPRFNLRHLFTSNNFVLQAQVQQWTRLFQNEHRRRVDSEALLLINHRENNKDQIFI